jgi:membrane-associated phospholipid phosphatase
MLGTFVGAVAALFLGMHFITLPLAGFALAALAIRIAVPRRTRVAG